jgi:hypothetical protein
MNSFHQELVVVGLTEQMWLPNHSAKGLESTWHEVHFFVVNFFPVVIHAHACKLALLQPPRALSEGELFRSETVGHFKIVG